MTTPAAQSPSRAWLSDLGAIDIDGADWHLGAESTVGARHGAAMRTAFAELEVSAYLTVESAPIAVFVQCDDGDAAKVARLHRALWNQGLASVLVIHFPTETRIYSLVARPTVQGVEDPSTDDLRLVRRLENAADALELSSVVPSRRTVHARKPLAIVVDHILLDFASPAASA